MWAEREEREKEAIADLKRAAAALLQDRPRPRRIWPAVPARRTAARIMTAPVIEGEPRA